MIVKKAEHTGGACPTRVIHGPARIRLPIPERISHNLTGIYAILFQLTLKTCDFPSGGMFPYSLLLLSPSMSSVDSTSHVFSCDSPAPLRMRAQHAR